MLLECRNSPCFNFSRLRCQRQKVRRHAGDQPQVSNTGATPAVRFQRKLLKMAMPCLLCVFAFYLQQVILFVMKNTHCEKTAWLAAHSSEKSAWRGKCITFEKTSCGFIAQEVFASAGAAACSVLPISEVMFAMSAIAGALLITVVSVAIVWCVKQRRQRRSTSFAERKENRCRRVCFFLAFFACFLG